MDMDTQLPETVVAYDHHGLVVTELGYNSLEDFHRVAENVVARNLNGAIINVRLPESERFAPVHATPIDVAVVKEKTGPTIASVDRDGNITIY